MTWSDGDLLTPSNLENKSNAPVFNVKDYGAVGDGSTDDHSAIQAAIDAATADKGVVFVPRTGNGYNFSSNLSNWQAIPIICQDELVFTGSGEPALSFGTLNDAANQYENEQPSIIRLRRNTQDWTDSNAGLALHNAYQAVIFAHVEDFEQGILLEDSLYNKVFPNRIKDNRVGIKLHATGNRATNQNTFLGGRINTASNTSSAKNVHGIEMVNDNGQIVNGNQFHNINVEIRNTGTGFTSFLHGSGSKANTGRNNNFVGFRSEGVDFLLSGKGLTANRFLATRGEIGANTPSSTLTADTDADLVDMIRNVINNTRNFDPYDGQISPVAAITPHDFVEVTGSANLASPGRGGWWSGSNVVGKIRNTGRLTDDVLTLTNADPVGFEFDLSDETVDYRRLIVVKRSSTTNKSGRVVAACLDNNENIISDEDACSLAFSSSDSFHQTGSDGGEFSITGIGFREDVQKTFVGVRDGSSDASLSLIEFGVPANSVIRRIPVEGVPEYRDERPKSDTTPISSANRSYQTGNFVHNTDAGAGQPLGWVWSGQSWQPHGAQAESFGADTLSLDGSTGEASFSHGLSGTPNSVLLTINGGDRAESIEFKSADASVVTVHGFQNDGSDLTGVSREVFWNARI